MIFQGNQSLLARGREGKLEEARGCSRPLPPTICGGSPPTFSPHASGHRRGHRMAPALGAAAGQGYREPTAAQNAVSRFAAPASTTSSSCSATSATTSIPCGLSGHEMLKSRMRRRRKWRDRAARGARRTVQGSRGPARCAGGWWGLDVHHPKDHAGRRTTARASTV